MFFSSTVLLTFRVNVNFIYKLFAKIQNNYELRMKNDELFLSILEKHYITFFYYLCKNNDFINEEG